MIPHLKQRLFKVLVDAKHSAIDARNYIYAAAMLYCLGIGVGWLMPYRFSFLNDLVKDLFNQFSNPGAFEFIASVFIHNVIVTYITMCLFVFFGLIPVVAALFNGVVVGWVVVSVPGVTTTQAVGMLAPHGLFEWPAMFMAWGTGLWRGVGYRFSDQQTSYLDRWLRANKVFFVIVLPLLIVAAIIEGRNHIAALF